MRINNVTPINRSCDRNNQQSDRQKQRKENEKNSKKDLTKKSFDDILNTELRKEGAFDERV